ncbi:MAG: type II toxin-antitoxin system Phd/YefM family antitoxin [Gemmatimonadota bacterium]
MLRASVSSLKARLSEYLRAVRNGEEVIVTDRGTPVARLAPLEPTERQDARAQKLIEAGLVRAAEGALPAGFWEGRRPADPDGLSLRALLEERHQGR